MQDSVSQRTWCLGVSTNTYNKKTRQFLKKMKSKNKAVYKKRPYFVLGAFLDPLHLLTPHRLAALTCVSKVSDFQPSASRRHAGKVSLVKKLKAIIAAVIEVKRCR